jgi:hypothetical protein
MLFSFLQNFVEFPRMEKTQLSFNHIHFYHQSNSQNSRNLLTVSSGTYFLLTKTSTNICSTACILVSTQRSTAATKILHTGSHTNYGEKTMPAQQRKTYTKINQICTECGGLYRTTTNFFFNWYL